MPCAGLLPDGERTGPALPLGADILWAQARALYETGASSQKDLAAALGVAQSTISRRARRERWQRLQRDSDRPRDDAVMTRRRLVTRLVRAFETQIAALERRARHEKDDGGRRRDPDKLAQRLASLAKTLNILLALHVASHREETESADADALRRELAQRLDRLCATRTAS